MKMTPDERKRRQQKKREEWDAELLRLHQRQFQSEPRPDRERASAQNCELLERIHEKMRGPEFRAWYEATTGMPVAEFLEKVLISPEQFLAQTIHRRDTPGFRWDQLTWTRYLIERVADQNPWRDPEKREYWAKEVAGAKDPRKRRAILIQLATPCWANKEKILAIYRERARIEAETGIPHDVDHIIPIVNQRVCGLHCEANLRVIPASENRSKSNRF